MDITRLLNVNSEPVAAAAAKASTRVDNPEESFTSLFNSMISNVGETNALLHKQEEEEMKFSRYFGEYPRPRNRSRQGINCPQLHGCPA